ncbi:MAG: hypothetical protein KUF74_08350 [Candidatus Thiodiazotropha sp. (ex Ctena orbiculata)]|nr:hypothetical protein [Candidatus Thiodiazotropha taylori]
MAYGHMEFNIVYLVINLSILSYAVSTMRDREACSNQVQALEMWAVWMVTSIIILIILFLNDAAILQVWFWRFGGTPVVQRKIALFHRQHFLSGSA